MNKTFASIWIVLGIIASAGTSLLLWAEYDFADPQFFMLLPVVPLIGFVYVSRLNKQYASVSHSNISEHELRTVPWKAWSRHVFFALQLIGITLLIVALARPQDDRTWEERWEEGIDIVIALDVSGSMLSDDIAPNRLEASKSVAMEFIGQRPHDRIGLVIYAGEAITQAPLTIDHELLQLLFSEVKHGDLKTGTAIGNALATSVSRLRKSETESKVVILLSDGVNEGGTMNPLDAIGLAKEYGIRVYTIAVGTNGIANTPTDIDQYGNTYSRPGRVQVDEDLLMQVAEETGGKFFRARSRALMQSVYKEIDRLEKSRIEAQHYGKKKDVYMPMAWTGLGFILLYHLLFSLIFRIID